MNAHWLGLGLAVLLMGCEPSYANLGEPLDPLVPFSKQSASFLLATEEGTELVTLELPDGSHTGRLAYFELARDGATHLREGGYSVIDGKLYTAFATDYLRKNEVAKAPASREGSRVTQLDPREAWEAVVTVQASPQRLLLEDSTGTRTLISLADALEALAAAPTPDPELLLRTCYLQIYSSQVRIPGFGGTGMTEYLNRTGVFAGLLAGEQRVDMDELLSPKNSFAFEGYSDLPGWRLDGQFSTSTNLGGDGTMAGHVDATLAGRSRKLEVGIDFAAVELAGGTDAGGTYGVTVKGATSAVDYRALKDLDLRGLMP